MQQDPMDVIRRWLGRFSFAFLAVAFFLGWEGYKRYQASGEQIADGRTLLDFLAAAISVVLGFTGLRERHRPRS
jgi:hypothetical protein